MANPPGESSGAISAPTGGGAIRGIGETFQANPFGGTGTFVVPIATSSGRDGRGPKLALEYGSGHGNGPFGIGWRLTIPRISRKTEKGLPRYGPDDVFVMSGAEDLMPCLVELRDPVANSVDWIPADAVTCGDRGQYTVTHYRPRTEGLFAQIERWERTVAGVVDVHWRATTKDNVTSVYGRTPRARVIGPPDPIDTMKPQPVFEWLIEETFDARGNHTWYEYARDDGRPRPDEVYEFGRGYGQLYPRRILYGNSHQSIGPRRTATDHERQAETRSRHYLLEVVFDYESASDPRAYPPGAAEGQEVTSARPEAWPVRPDPFSSFRTGFEIRTVRRCERVRVFHHFAELGGARLVRSTRLRYDEDPDTRLSLLASVTTTGHRRDADGTWHTASLPAVTFSYSQFRPEGQRYQSLSSSSDDYPPFALGHPALALVDLFGTGLPDVVHSSPVGLRYWRNLGGGVLDDPRVLESIPAGLTLATPGVGFGDLDGDGRVELMVHAGPLQGFWEARGNGSWDTFRAYPTLPPFDLADPDVRLVDLTGDGRADVLVTRPHHFLWYECKGVDGFVEGGCVERLGADEFPDVSFSDSSGRVRLADMTGDGLVDIVWLHEGQVDYWPNLGYGRFGRRITMGAIADAPDRGWDFDPQRLFLVDLNGTGCADLVYVEAGAVHFWFNQSGNAWSARHTIDGTPPALDPAALRFADVFGTGTATLVWSYDFGTYAGGNIKALDFCGGAKPYLLTEMDNGLGATTRLAYQSSTRFAIEDSRAGRPWATALPFPVHVVVKVETIDHVARSKLVTTYGYHHGYYDGHEREFRGFGCVDQWDTEEYELFAGSGLHGDGAPVENADPRHHLPPVLVRTWFHTGASYEEGDELTRRLRDEFYARDPHAFTLDPPTFESTGPDEWREACRALRGAALRSEVYAMHYVGEEPLAGDHHPYVVTDKRFAVRRLQPAGPNPYGVYLTTPKETLTHQYERQPDDPRIAHEIVLEVDEYGNVTKRVAIAYPRRPPPAGEPPHPTEQKRLTAVLTWGRFVNTPEFMPPDADFYFAGVPCETRRFEITGADALWDPHDPHLLGDNRFLDVSRDQDVFAAPTDAPTHWGKRLLEWSCTYFRNDTAPGEIDAPRVFDHRLPLGRIDRLGLPYATYRAAFPPTMPGTLFDNKVSEGQLRSAGYIRAADLDTSTPWPDGTAGYWWALAGTQAFEPGAEGFFQAIEQRDAFGNPAWIARDAYKMFVVGTVDAVGNSVQAEIDYAALLPRTITDPNGNRTRLAFDALGRLSGTAVTGKEPPAPVEDDSLEGFRPDPTEVEIDQLLDDPAAAAVSLLGRATTRIIYQPSRSPAFSCALARETHVSELEPGESSRVVTTFVYSDGFGREVQTKAQVDEARWVGSGWTIYNNKGNAVRRYEPFFSDTHAFEYGRVEGVSPTLFYDPLQRVVATLRADHSYEKVVWDAWRQESWDANDTIGQSPLADPDVAPFFAALPVGDYEPSWYERRAAGTDPAEAEAADKAAGHADTPTAAHLDTRGRSFLTVVQTGTEELPTRVDLDVQGHDIRLTDPRGIVSFENRFDMLGRKLRIDGRDAGLRVSLLDPTGKPVIAGDANGNVAETAYDALRRPIAMTITKVDGTSFVAQTIEYGESAAAHGDNLRGRVWRVRDGAGVLTHTAYDLDGSLRATVRQIVRDPVGVPNWSATAPPVVLVDDERFYVVTEQDALGRPRHRLAGTLATGEPEPGLVALTPDQEQQAYMQHFAFNLAGQLQQASIRVDGDDDETPVVTAVDYNARGQRTEVQYANGASTTFTYDALTFRLQRVATAVAGGPALQDVRYTYDPVGNVMRAHDRAFASVFNYNSRIDPITRYSYDAAYRLTDVRGREHEAMSRCSHVHPNGSRRTKQAEWIGLTSQPVNNGQAIRNYTERYGYDRSGNLASIVHFTSQPVAGWTRTQGFASDSNRLTASTVGCAYEPSGDVRHDSNGNITSLAHLPHLEWDHANRLLEARTTFKTDGAIADTVRCVYDANGQRVRKVVERGGAIAEDRLYLGDWELVREFSGASPIERRTYHVAAAGRRIALVEVTNDPAVPARTIRYQHDNMLGSSLLELDDAARPIAYEEYYPYGGTSYLGGVAWATSRLKRYRFNGKERDDETGLYYYGARYYAPWLGRWLNADPAGPVDGSNLFAYVRNNPIVSTDRTGLSADADAGVPHPDVAGFPDEAVAAPASPSGTDSLDAGVPAAGVGANRPPPLDAGDVPPGGVAPKSSTASDQAIVQDRIDEAIKVVAADPEFRRRADDPSYRSLDSNAGKMRNLQFQREGRAPDALSSEGGVSDLVCTGIAKQAVTVVNKAKEDGRLPAGVSAETISRGDRSWEYAHTAVKLTVEVEGRTYERVVDWHQTLDADNPRQQGVGEWQRDVWNSTAGMTTGFVGAVAGPLVVKGLLFRLGARSAALYALSAVGFVPGAVAVAVPAALLGYGVAEAGISIWEYFKSTDNQPVQKTR